VKPAVETAFGLADVHGLTPCSIKINRRSGFSREEAASGAPLPAKAGPTTYPATSGKSADRTPTGDTPAACVRTADRTPCCDPIPGSVQVHALRSLSETPARRP